MIKKNLCDKYVSNKLLLESSSVDEKTSRGPRSYYYYSNRHAHKLFQFLLFYDVYLYIFLRSCYFFREGLERGKYNNSPIIHGLVNISNEFPDDSYLENY